MRGKKIKGISCFAVFSFLKWMSLENFQNHLSDFIVCIFEITYVKPSQITKLIVDALLLFVTLKEISEDANDSSKVISNFMDKFKYLLIQLIFVLSCELCLGKAMVAFYTKPQQRKKEERNDVGYEILEHFTESDIARVWHTKQSVVNRFQQNLQI